MPLRAKNRVFCEAIEKNLVLEVGVEPTWPVKAAGF